VEKTLNKINQVNNFETKTILRIKISGLRHIIILHTNFELQK
jgi:hypothetical protein